MISEGSRHTEDWSKSVSGLLKISFAITGINCILKYITIKTFFQNLTVLLFFLYFILNKYSLGEHNILFLLTPIFLNGSALLHIPT